MRTPLNSSQDCATGMWLSVCVCAYHMRLNVHKILLRSLQAALASATECERATP